MIPDVKRRLAAAYKDLEDKVVRIKETACHLERHYQDYDDNDDTLLVMNRRIQLMQEVPSCKMPRLFSPKRSLSRKHGFCYRMIVDTMNKMKGKDGPDVFMYLITRIASKKIALILPDACHHRQCYAYKAVHIHIV